MENMTDALNNIKKIEAMQNEITNIITRPNTKLDEDCREAFVALGTARTKLANLFFQLAEERARHKPPRREKHMKWYEIFAEFIVTAMLFVTVYLVMVFVFIL